MGSGRSCNRTLVNGQEERLLLLESQAGLFARFRIIRALPILVLDSGLPFRLLPTLYNYLNGRGGTSESQTLPLRQRSREWAASLFCKNSKSRIPVHRRSIKAVAMNEANPLLEGKAGVPGAAPFLYPRTKIVRGCAPKSPLCRAWHSHL